MLTRSTLYIRVFKTLVLYFFVCTLQAQNINLSLPVGTPQGAGKVSASGGSSYTIPITVLTGINGMQPTVSLVYNSQSGEGVAGWGWNLSGMSVISRAGKNNYHNGITTPVKYTNTNDAFLLDGQRMIVTSGTNGANGAVYGLENEQFSKIESFGGSETVGPEYFRVTTKNGVVMDYGHATNTKMLTEDGATMLWFLNKVTDINGNYQQYIYAINNTSRIYQLSEIQYTGNTNTGTLPAMKVAFGYNTRSDWAFGTTYDAGASIRKGYLLTSIKVKNASGQDVRTYDLSYLAQRGHYLLSSVKEKGADGSSAFNPINFTYGSNTTAPDVSTSMKYPNMHQGNVCAGDFDGDGKQDILQSNYYIDNNNVPHYTSYDILSDFSTYAGQPAISFFYNYTIPQTGATEVKGTSNGYYNFLTYDFDGDSKEDVLMINSLTSGSDRIYNGIRINYSRNFSVYSGPTYDSANYAALPRSVSYTSDFKYVYRNGTTFGSYFVPGDFDGDGAEDYILVLGINSANSFKGFFSSPQRGIFNQEIAQFGVEGTSTDPFYATSIASATQLMPIDFDGDGKREILVVKGTQSYVLSVYPVSITSGYNYAAQVLYTVAGIKSNYPVFPGDFNGDGKTDLLYRAGANSATASWYQLISTGKAYLSNAFGFSDRPYLPGDKGGSAHHLMVADLNGDGKTDVWHSLDLSSTSSRHTIYYSSGQSFNIESYNQAVATNGSEQANTVIGDFNGDGKPDILGINSAGKGTFIYVKPFKEEHMLTGVVNGLGAQEGFTYALTTSGGLYNRSAAYQYDKRGVPIGSGVNGHSYNVLSTPMYLVSQHYQSNGIGNGLNYSYYSYTDAAFHRSRGFLGFKKLNVTDDATGIVTTTEMAIDANILVPYTTHQYNTLGSETLSDVTFTGTFVKPGSDKRYTYQVLKILSNNGITGAATETSNAYDNYGNVTQSVTKVGSLSGTTVNAVETSTINTAYGAHNTPVPAMPERVIQSNLRSGQAAISNTSTYTYNTFGQLVSSVNFAGKPNAVTSTYAFDAFGNITKTDISAAGLTTRTQSFVYDYTGRFLTQTITSANGLNKKETFTYEPLFGNVATQVSSDGLRTAHTYDVFGRMANTTLPEGYNVTQAYTWERTGGRYAVSMTRPAGGRNTKTYYDILGRDTRQEISGFNGATLVSTKEYNNKGQVINTVDPYYSSETPITANSQYDNYGRVIKLSNGTISATYGYSKLANGQYKTTTTTGSGQSSSQTTDAAGVMIAAGDNGGTLNYTYNSQGNLLQVQLNGTIMSTCTYDDYGNQLSLIDVNAGTYSYVYDAFGHMTKQTAPGGQVTTLAFDGFGRILNRIAPEGTTAYEYWSDAATGYCNDRVTKISGFAGEIKEYTYDNLRRPLTEKVTIDGSSFTTTYAYDAYSMITKITYPSGLVITNTVDRNGTVTGVNMGEGAGASPLFAASAMNSLGRYTAYRYGNGRSTTETYNLPLALQTQSTTAGVQNMSYTYDLQTGDLLNRKDLLKNLEEIFTYDNLNRLQSSKVNNVQQLAIGYDGGTSSSLGNISAKTDAGNYTYNSQRVNTLAYVTNPAGPMTPPSVISQAQQDITYTPFQKTYTISEGVNKLTYTYGSDYQRIKGEQTVNGVLAETRYYLGNYEKQVKGATNREIHYIGGGNGLCAIIVKESGVTNVYYTYTDNLGSILNVTNASGVVVASQNFDAWGRYRNPSDWTYNNIPTQPEWLYRGFTGHEHLKDFALINMNGRIYDPVLGRMLSPDDYVQSISATQGFNRYTYALNNPLKYTDISGEYLGIDDLLAAAIGGIVNFGINYFQGNVGSFWQGVGYFAAGAAAGDLALYGPAGWALGGAITGAANSALQGAAVDQVIQSTLVGAISGVAGGAAGGAVSDVIGPVISNGLRVSVNSVVTRGLQGAVGGAVGGYVSGFSTGFMSTGDLGAASKAGLNGMVLGAGIGLTVGTVTAIRDNRIQGLNAITGVRNGRVELGTMTMQMPQHLNANGELVTGTRYATDLGNGGKTTITFGGSSEPLLLGPSKFPKLAKHFDNHSGDWGPEGSIEIHDYYNQAVNLSQSPIGGDIMGFTSPQGWIFRYNNANNTFLTIHPTGYIETFYQPTNGLNYYLNQIVKYNGH